MILRQMPALAHEPFRRWFYQHWGRENCLIAARTRHADYPPYKQRLSIKAVWGYPLCRNFRQRLCHG